ncbi:helix-turn-helix domain-containing protein [Cytobacillus solani]|uniref:helix-turn-helix domain-containing protein n=1 Tax=Cytobacillus solani TaxID=1637975 RepID=UPI00207B07E2|nr:helix-turn-helix transcriptional regulator [Cytobacillus solani]USK54399.1 helix-turn-helix domain-containing protein [Cytobacillus solani]
MDKRTEVIERLIDETGLSKKAFAEKIGLPPTTLRSMLQRGVGNASVDNVIKVCKGLGITTEELEDMANGEKLHKTDKSLPELNAKDEKDIQIELQKMIEGLSSSGYAAFDGRTPDELSEEEREDRELLLSSLENSLRLAKRVAKQKFTPKKYRK